jgi:pyruvate/2-oxoglutarate dehydrogenase complex dihydrolipoamide acyltransferase (E2) component
MIYQLVVPSMGGVQELRVLQWHRAEGERLEADQLLLELETEKAVVEVRSPRACVLRKIAVEQGGWAQVGPALAYLSDDVGETIQSDSAEDFLPKWEVI